MGVFLIAEVNTIVFAGTGSELGSGRSFPGSSYTPKGPLLMAASRTEEKLARKIFANILIVANFHNVTASLSEAGDCLKASACTSSD